MQKQLKLTYVRQAYHCLDNAAHAARAGRRAEARARDARAGGRTGGVRYAEVLLMTHDFLLEAETDADEAARARARQAKKAHLGFASSVIDRYQCRVG